MAEALHESELRRRFAWILILRAALAVVFGGAVLVAFREADPRPPMYYTAVLFGIVLLLDLILLLLRRWQPYSVLLLMQLFFDFLIITAAIYVSNAAESVFTFLYFLLIIEAAIVHSRGASLILASLSTIGSTGVSILYYLHSTDTLLIPWGEFLTEGLTDVNPQSKILFLVGQMVAFYTVSVFAGILAEDLRRLNLLHDLLLENMPEGIVAIDGQQRVTFLNMEARKLLTIPPSAIAIGRPVKEVLQGEEAESVAELLLSPEGDDWELILPGPKGLRSVNLRVSSTRDRRGRMRGAVGVLTDLTMKKRLEAAERTAEHLEGLREVAAGIAHEIRNPLASIRGCVQEISRGSLGDAEQAEMSEIIRRESDRLDHILQEFLQFTGMRDPVLAPVRVSDLLDEVVILLENREGMRPREVEKNYTGEHVIQGDRRQLQQVFLNLGINAIEASEGQKPIRFELKGAKITRFGSHRVGTTKSQRMLVADAVEISVGDEGGGLAPDVLPKAFTPFFTTKKSGTGLGLSVVSRIVRGHGGEIEVDNHPGQGCTFRVRLPVNGETDRPED